MLESCRNGRAPQAREQGEDRVQAGVAGISGLQRRYCGCKLGEQGGVQRGVALEEVLPRDGAL